MCPKLKNRSQVKLGFICEHSGALASQFWKLGYTVVSCDLKKADVPWNHYTGNCFDLDLTSFDALFCFPPCTYLAKAQLWRCVPGSKFYEKHLDAIRFIKSLLNCGCPKIFLENPIGALPKYIGHATQIVYPYYFGDPWKKEICLWLKNMPPLMSTQINTIRKPIQNKVNGRMSQDLKSEIKSSWLHYPFMCRSIAVQYDWFLSKELNLCLAR